VPDNRSHTATWRRYAHPALIAWAVYLFLVPFYVFKSGLPQPGDMFVVLLVPIALRGWNGKLPPSILTPMRALLWFTLWVVVVDYAWAFILGNFGLFGTDTFILFPLYYIYNAMLFLVGLILYRQHGDVFLRITLYMVYGTVLVQVAASFVYQPGARGSLFFNNPNQLGYFALLAACMIVLLHWRLRLKLWFSSMALASCGYLAAVSASRAAIAGVAILLMMLLFANPRVIIALSVVALALVFLGGPIADAVKTAEDRVRNRRSHVGFMEERGYDRIVEYKEYLLFGAGEGGLSRFADTPQQHKEIHSSIGTVVFSYGVIGAYLFFVFVWRLVRGARLRLWMVLLPPLFYAVAHQGLRFTMMWVLLAVFLALKAELIKPKPVGQLAGAS
jgi:hypothetical protein